jgi:Family of unknown function (DUF6459)
MPVLPPDRPSLPPVPGRSRRPRRRPAGDPRPLPDPAAVRLCRIPDSAPPYDSDTAASPPPAPAHSAGPAAPAGRASPPQSRGPAGLPVPAATPAWPGYFAQVLAETLAGVRPATQLVPWTTERARSRIQQLGPRLAAGQRPRIRRVVTFRPSTDAMEMTVVVGFGPRVHALALRLERAGTPGRWLCTTVEAA